jgi:hypothetical protein
VAAKVVVGKIGDGEIREQPVLGNLEQHLARRRVVHTEAMQHPADVIQRLSAHGARGQEIADRDDRRCLYRFLAAHTGQQPERRRDLDLVGVQPLENEVVETSGTHP